MNVGCTADTAGHVDSREQSAAVLAVCADADDEHATRWSDDDAALPRVVWLSNAAVAELHSVIPAVLAVYYPRRLLHEQHR
jgi:hypothetical protein